MPLAVVGWPDVMVALIAGLPAIISAIVALRVHREIQTPNGNTIGTQVEQSQRTALASNYRLQAIGNGLDVEMPEAAAHEEARVEELNTMQTRKSKHKHG
jgi:hypothetical protein